MKINYVFLFSFYFLTLCFAKAQVINTLAGTSQNGYSGDGNAAIAAKLFSPMAVAADGSGNVYIVDFLNNVVRKVNSLGIIKTFAGTGAIGYSGDGGLAISAELYYPRGVAVDASGNIHCGCR